MDLQGLREWYQTEVGKTLLQSLEEELRPLVSRLFGYVAVQIGQLSDQSDLLESCTIHQKWRIDTQASPHVVADPVRLPVANDSLDLVILPHTLDFASDAHQVLREADRVLVPEGHVIIIGLNPFSFYGVWRLWNLRNPEPPWNGGFYHLGRIKDWLALLGFEVCSVSYCAHGLPISSMTLYRKTEVLRRQLSKHAPWLGGIYICVARKKMATLTPTLGKWKSPAGLIPKTVVKPTVRIKNGR